MTDEQPKSDSSSPKATETYDVLDPVPAVPRSEAKSPPKAEIKAPALLSDFDEDADFDRDPDVERARRGGSGAAATANKPPKARGPRGVLFASPDVDEEPFVKPGLGDERALTIAGVVLMIAAIVAVLINAPNNSLARALLVAFQCMVHAATGLAAVGAAATMLGRPLGPPELAAARMFAAVGLFQFIVNLNLMLLSSRVDEIIVAALAYIISVWVLFRRPIDQILVVGGFHFLGWLAVFVTGQLYIWAQLPTVAAK
jgi:hypothetical protein